MDELDKVSISLNDTIVDSNLADFAKDGLELGIDSLMKDGILKEIPIIRILVGLINSTQNISNRLFLKKIISFLRGISEIPADKRKKMIDKIDKSKKYKNKVSEKLLFIIEHCEDDVKSEYIAHLFKSFIKEEATYDEFINGTSIINRLTTADFNRFIKQEQLYIEDSEFIGVGLTYVLYDPITVTNEITGDWDDPQNFHTYGGELEVYSTKIGDKLKKIFANIKI